MSVRRLARPYLILADDLTGANDAGVQFARIGLHTQVCFSTLQERALEESDIVVIDTDSRASGARIAYQRVHAAASFAAQRGAPILFKKLDSTLRGEIGAELDAVIDVYGSQLVVLAPAFPTNQRTLHNGTLYLGGVPVAQSHFAKDGQTPVRISHLPTLLAEQTRRPVHLLGVDAITAGPHRLGQQLHALRASGGAIVVCDAVTDAHLAVITDATLALGEGCLLAGSAGLARPLALRICGHSGEHRAEHVLVITGSMHPVMREQVRELVRRHAAFVVSLDLAAAFDEQRWPHWIERTLQRIDSAPANAPIVLAAPSAPVVGEQSALLLPRLIELAGHVMAHVRVLGVVATGGATTRQLCDDWGASGLGLLDEIAPGIALGAIRGGVHNGLALVTKAGGFGDANALVTIVQRLHDEQGRAHA
jgi:uncharacterized protein YgbK (DUF1537 family)